MTSFQNPSQDVLHLILKMLKTLWDFPSVKIVQLTVPKVMQKQVIRLSQLTHV